MSKYYYLGTGKQEAERVLEKIGEQPIDLINKKWEDRPKSNIIKWLMAQGSYNVKTIADYLDITSASLNNKLVRGTFSFDEMVMVAAACGYTLAFVNMDRTKEYYIDPEQYFSHYKQSEYGAFKTKLATSEENALLQELKIQIKQFEAQKQALEKRINEMEYSLKAIETHT